MRQNIQDDIDEILDFFDFERVYLAMKALDWKWPAIGRVPLVGHLRAKARELLNRVAYEYGDSCSVGTGGFIAEMNRYPGDEKTYLRLYFSVSEYSNNE